MTGHGVYLICFDSPFKHAKHYLGWASNISERVETHRAGKHGCAKLIAAVNAAGIAWEVTRVWPNVEKDFERKLKNQKQGPRLCPRCKGNA